MDVKDLLNSEYRSTDADIEVTGWIVDEKSGLYLLGDHYPENYGFPIKVKISNPNIIYQIFKTVPRLGGGKSALFYKAKVIGVMNENNELEANSIYIQTDRSINELHAIDISEELVADSVRKFGDYNFNYSRDPMQDWLDDFK